MPERGSQSSVSGKAYEILIAARCAQFRSPHIEVPFNTQTKDELGGCSAAADIVLNWSKVGDISVEAKCPTPDWMQMKLHKTDGGWIGSETCKIPAKSRLLFDSFLKGAVLFNNQVPTFLERDLTYPEWTAIKAVNKQFSDHYINCAKDTISSLYREKGCQYIQVKGKGLYHTGADVCGFGVPYFECEQRIRIRIKVHSRNLGSVAKLSVMAAAQPVNLKSLIASPFSLDGLMPTSLLQIQ